MSLNGLPPAGPHFYTTAFRLPDRTGDQSRSQSQGTKAQAQMQAQVQPQPHAQLHAQPQAQETLASLRHKYNERGLLIQKHERRLKDSNALLEHMWRRLDPDFNVGRALQDGDFCDHIAKRAQRAFSDNPHMQDYFDRLAAFDYLYETRHGRPAGDTVEARLRSEKRIGSLAATVKVQTALIQENTDEIKRLEAQLIKSKYYKSNATIQRLEMQLSQAKAKITSLNIACNTPLNKDKRTAALALAPAAPRRPAVLPPRPSTRLPTQPRALVPHKLPETAFGGVPDNHPSLTFNGFSHENAINPARLQMLSTPAPLDAIMPGSEPLDAAPPSSGANTARLGPSKRRHATSTQSSRVSSAAFGVDVDGGVLASQRSGSGSKRAMPFLDYDDAVDDSSVSNKRIKSGVLTPPLPEELIMGPPHKDLPGDGGVPIQYEELELGEIREAGDHKYAVEDLDQLILEAQNKIN